MTTEVQNLTSEVQSQMIEILKIFSEHRINFFLLLQAINKGCFSAFLEIPPQMFKLILDSIVWGYKHTMRNVNDTGLEIMLQLLKNVESRGAQGQARVLSFFVVIFHN